MSLAAAHAPTAPATPLPALVVFAGTRWRFDWQRPQQLLSRLAAHYRVLYVEEPLATHADPWLERVAVAPGVELLVPHTRCDAAGFTAAQLPVLRGLLTAFLHEEQVVEPLVWTDVPAARSLAEALQPRAVVYDCHRDAAPDVEAALLRLADVVIAGGPSLYESQRPRHANVHCIPNAVDATHFAPPALAGQSIEAVSARAIHADIPNPRLGFFGVIDERVDLDLVARLADLRPDWHFVMAGPLRGVPPQALPRRANVAWLGAQTYAILPHLQAHWDVCILPLKCAETAHRAAPIEALEFLAGQKSVVSTPVHDIVTLHGHIVRLAPGVEAFAEACRTAMCERGPLRRQRRIDALIAVHSCTWERAAERVRRLLVEFAHEPAPLEVPAALLATARQGAWQAAAQPRA